jgi:hypothetical protein
VFDFKCLVNDKVWIKYIKSKKFNGINIREVHADGSYQTLVLKHVLTQNSIYNVLGTYPNNPKHTCAAPYI